MRFPRATHLNVYVRSRKAGERVMQGLRRLVAKLRLRVNETRSAVAPAVQRQFLGFSFWFARGGIVKRRLAPTAILNVPSSVATRAGLPPRNPPEGCIPQTPSFLIPNKKRVVWRVSCQAGLGGSPIAERVDVATLRIAVAPKAMGRMKDRVRQITRRSGGKSVACVCEQLRACLTGWKAYFQIADTPRVFADIDKWIRHRLRALQLRQWKRGRTIYRELVKRGMSGSTAAKVAANGRRWWRHSAMEIHIALPNRLFDELGVPRLVT